MAEESFPIVEQPMSADQWKSVTLGVGDGILDVGGYPYRLNGFSNATNTGVVRASTTTGYSAAILKGFYHKIDEDVTVDFPAVTSTTLYYVVLQYDPLREASPVELKVVTSLDESQGKAYLHLYNVYRQPNQLLTDAVVRMVRPRVAPATVYATEADMPQAHKVLWGSLAIVHGGRGNAAAKIFVSMNGDAEETTNGRVWQLIYDQNPAGTFAWAERGDTGSYYSPTHGYNRAIGRRGKVRKLRGRVARVSGATFNPNNDYQVWSSDLPPTDAPTRTQRFLVAVGGSSAAYGVVEVSQAGSITAWVSATTYWIGFDGIEWEVA